MNKLIKQPIKTHQQTICLKAGHISNLGGEALFQESILLDKKCKSAGWCHQHVWSVSSKERKRERMWNVSTFITVEMI